MTANHDTPARAEAAAKIGLIAELFRDVPAAQQPGVLREALEALERIHVSHGAAVPAWIGEARRILSGG